VFPKAKFFEANGKWSTNVGGVFTGTYRRTDQAWGLAVAPFASCQPLRLKPADVCAAVWCDGSDSLTA